MSTNNMMPTIKNAIYVPGWEKMIAKHTTRARVLQALVNCELKGIVPTVNNLITEIRQHIDLSPKSGASVLRHLKRLAELGHITYLNHQEKGKPTGRSGPTAPWRSKYVFHPLTTQNNISKETKQKKPPGDQKEKK